MKQMEKTHSDQLQKQKLKIKETQILLDVALGYVEKYKKEKKELEKI